MFLALLAALAVTLPPAPAGRCILDTPHVLAQDDFRALESACESIDKAGDGQIAVAIVNDLQGMDRPEYAANLFRAWGIGHKGKDDGILILVALPPASRGIKVEIGYGLEGRLNDGKAMAAVRERALPQFKQGRIGTGLRNLVAYYGQQMHQERVEYAPTPQVYPAPSVQQAKPPSAWTVFLVLLGMAALLGLGLWWIAHVQQKEDEKLRRREAEEAEERRRQDLAARAARLVRTRTDIEPQAREKLTTFVHEVRPNTVIEPLPMVYTPLPEPVRHVRTPPAPAAPKPVVKKHHYEEPVRSSSSDDDSWRSSSSSSSSDSSSSSSSWDSGSSSSGGDFGGFGGGSSGGGGGDAGW
jgi:uncharacterized membrane protein YgcG